MQNPREDMITIREPALQDEEKFLSAMQRSVQLHHS